MNEITLKDDDSLFKVESMPIRSQEKDLNVQMDIMIEMNLDMGLLARNGYTFIDVLSDIGGIQSILISVISILIGLFNYNHFDTYMAARLFKIRPKDGLMGEQQKEIQPTQYGNIG